MEKMGDEELTEYRDKMYDVRFSDKITKQDVINFDKAEAELHRRLARLRELETEVEKLKEQVDFERTKAGHLDWVKGQKAVEAMEKLVKDRKQGLCRSERIQLLNNTLQEWEAGNE